MATASINYAAAQAITVTLTSLASAGYRSSVFVDNSVNKYMDAHVMGSVQIGAPTVDGTITVFAYGSVDGGTLYSGGLDGTDTAITWGTTPSTSTVEGFNQLKLLGVMSVDSTDDANDLEFGPFAVAPAFGGVLPQRWGLVFLNETGVILNATGTNNAVKYQGIKYDSA